MIIRSLLLMCCLHFSFIDRGDQYATFKKMKGKKNKNNCYLSMYIQVISSIIKCVVKRRIHCQTSTAVPHFVSMLGFILVKRAPVNNMRMFAHQYRRSRILLDTFAHPAHVDSVHSRIPGKIYDDDCNFQGYHSGNSRPHHARFDQHYRIA